jgi:hypothetical protein
MAVRSTMADLIERVRQYIGDEGAEQYTDQRIQDALDMPGRHFDQSYLALSEQGTILSGGSVRFYDFRGGSDWEGAATFYDGGYNVITPDTYDWARGHWHFAGSVTPPYGPTRPVLISGATYDLHAAAADLLEQWAGSVKTSVDFNDANNQWKLSQQYDHLMALAQHHRGQEAPTTIRMWRSDTA